MPNITTTARMLGEQYSAIFGSPDFQFITDSSLPASIELGSVANEQMAIGQGDCDLHGGNAVIDKDREVHLKIEQVAREEATSLDLSGSRMSEVPVEVFGLSGLQHLDLSNNELSELPAEISQLTNLEVLLLSNNRLGEVPVEVFGLSGLQHLDLSYNELSELPAEISQLTNLQALYVSNNYLAAIPSEIMLLTELRELQLEWNAIATMPAETGQLTHLRILSLVGNKLITLFPEIEQLTELEHLDLSYTGLTEIPPVVFELTNLKVLELQGLQLATLPPEITQLFELTALNLWRTSLTELPREIYELTNLEVLLLSHNELSEVSADIGRLRNLRELLLQDNELSELPAEISQLTNLEDLTLSDNQLNEVPVEVFGLSGLQVLDLSNNELSELPAEISQLTNLEVLLLSNNRLGEVPVEVFGLSGLQHLDLSYNELSELPAEISQLTNLEVLDLRNNPIPIPPEILEHTREPSVIINYVQQTRIDERRPLNEAKVLLVGQGGVGKTSLAKQLMGEIFDPHENKTEGIDIRQWPVTAADQEILLNVWDFGGQEIMHATHQFFLTKRSLYVLVLDARLGEEENRVEYWLKLIQSFGGDSPIIVVGNKVDQQGLDVDRRGLQAKYIQLKDFVETSCEEGTGIKNLKEVIVREASKLKHIHDRLLLSWFTVKSRLEEMDRDYISYEEYMRLCKAENVIDVTSQQTLIRFLHDLGIVLNFQDDPRLEDTNILNPEWVTKAVYRILNSNELFQGKGILERQTLDHILDYREYPKDKHMFILDMMRKFELCFNFEGFTDRKFLVPDLLSKEEPYTGEWDDALAFQYHYNVLPTSVISRFIVRMHSHIYQNTAWRTGVVLAYDEGKALVKADTEDKKIFIWVSGPQRARRTFLAIIRSHFASIHETITSIRADEKVPLPNNPEIVVDYEHLLTLEVLREATFIPEGLSERVDVRQLLDGVEREQERRHRQDIGATKEGISASAASEREKVITQDALALAQLSEIKTNLDSNGELFARRCLWVFFIVLVVVWSMLAYLIYRLGWETMEPWTYLVGGGIVLVGYLYVALTQRQWSPIAMYQSIVSWKQRKNYRAYGFDLESYEELASRRPSYVGTESSNNSLT